MNKFKKTLSTLLLLLVSSMAYSQTAAVMEIIWTDAAGTKYQGLVVVNNELKGFIKEFYNSPTAGKVWVTQDVVIDQDKDRFGNMIVYITCSNPVYDNTNVSYSPDTFVIYPNNTYFTQDSGGNSSTDVTINFINEADWQSKHNEYGLTELEPISSTQSNTFGNDTRKRNR